MMECGKMENYLYPFFHIPTKIRFLKSYNFSQHARRAWRDYGVDTPPAFLAILLFLPF